MKHPDFPHHHLKLSLDKEIVAKTDISTVNNLSITKMMNSWSDTTNNTHDTTVFTTINAPTLSISTAI
ncbi:hypothetical protein CLV51_101808 [Chitinophaga niastensis]|uniref:Uncharacterized protein n=1 Tax=Chitinophaga niastensis TaxID=536980 RepID=A0A2P8HTG2_CHINA|nr:hypothetical protein [Chitinophaga niastensis]PSL49475.1 hypothetical protein CLV51_101808 [Chitinophaga niastensis]